MAMVIISGQGHSEVNIIPESKCMCFDFIDEVGAGPVTECILVSIEFLINRLLAIQTDNKKVEWRMAQLMKL